MKPYVFAIGVLLMLAFSTAGIASLASSVLRQLDARYVRTAAFPLAVVLLVALIAALAWSVPPRA
jgi:hypothetical protein